MPRLGAVGRKARLRGLRDTSPGGNCSWSPYRDRARRRRRRRLGI